MTRRKRGKTKVQGPAARDAAEAARGTPPRTSAAHFRRSREWILASLSGALIALACCKFQWGWAAWIALLPLLWVIDHAANLRRAIALSWWCGAVASFGTVHWMIALIARFTAAPLAAALAGHVIFSAYQGLVFLLFGWIVYLGRRRLALPMTLLAPVALVASQASVWFLFPYGIEISQAFYPPVIQVADVLGRSAVAAMLALASAAAYDLLRARGAQAKIERRCAAAGLSLLVAALAYGQVRLQVQGAQIAAAPQLRIGIVQPDADAALPGTEQGPASAQLEAQLRKVAQLRRASQDLVARGAQLIVWSEVSYGGLYPQARSQDFPDGDPRAISSGIGAPLVAGSLTQDASGHQYNSAIVFAPGGSIIGRYDKNILVPFGEYIPELVNFAWVRRLALGTGPGLLPGAVLDPISIPIASGAARWSIGMLICYEDVLPELTLRIGERHPNLLVNLSDDAWFDSEIESRQHLAMAVYAAVEQRLSLVRAVNPGVSAVVDPAGRVIAQSRFESVAGRTMPAETMLAVVPMVAQGTRIYVVVGHWFPRLCQLASLGMLLGVNRKLRRRPSRDAGRGGVLRR